MATDLPKRPEPDHEESRIVDPTERVKSVADKTDPRFEAARARADKEAEMRARQEAMARVPGDSPGDGGRAGAASADVETEEPDETAPHAAKGSFSFNLTAGDAKDDQ